jgi:hypothetical protein
MRQPSEIEIGEKTLAQVLADHLKWLRDKPDGIRADLSSANLRYANLSSANLEDADLRYAVGVLSIGPVGSRRAILIAVKHEKAIFIKAGCFWGTLQEFAGAVDETYGENKHAKNYKAAIALIETFFAED